MYLKELYIEHNGPLERLNLELSFTSRSSPKPTVFVGSNGSGKTNLLSIFADALFEAAAQHYTDTVAGNLGIQRNWFRVVGGLTGTIGEPEGLIILKFDHQGEVYLFKEKRGNLLVTEASKRVPESLRGALSWVETPASLKEFSISEDKVTAIFESGPYVYFPSSRAEMPHWLNQGSLPPSEFDLSAKFSKRLAKPIFVERGLEQFQQWLLGVMLESRQEIALAPNEAGHLVNFQIVGNVGSGLASQSVLLTLNKILSIILDANAQFVWLGRGSSSKLGIAINQNLRIPTLTALSGGQSTLLTIFGTLMRYADNGQWGGALPLQSVSGICIIDEIDAHMHVDLQHRALPELIKLFPQVQFLMSSHSPLFGLGMEQTFGTEGIEIIDMPSGIRVQAEAYSEFGQALQALQNTKAFNATIKAFAETPGKLLVLMEGETDPIYFMTAAQLQGFDALLNTVEFEWVGAKDPKSGQGFHTGKDALNQTRATLLANPTFVHRPVLLLYDNDVNKGVEDHGLLHVRSMPKSVGGKIKSGVESLLLPQLITDKAFDTAIKDRPDGGQTLSKTLNKMRLCKFLCGTCRNASDFDGFTSILKEIEAIAKSHMTNHFAS